MLQQKTNAFSFSGTSFERYCLKTKSKTEF